MPVHEEVIRRLHEGRQALNDAERLLADDPGLGDQAARPALACLLDELDSIITWVEPDGDRYDRAVNPSADDGRQAQLGDFTVAEQDALLNRVAEHNAGEHTTTWYGCPWCDGDVLLAAAVERAFGLEPVLPGPHR